MNFKQLMILMMICVLISSLINNTVYGPPTLAAYFYFVIAACLFSMTVFSLSFFNSNSRTFIMPLHVLIFNLFFAYIITHGMLTRTIGLTHLYWTGSAVFFNAVYFLRQQVSIQDEIKLLANLGNGILAIALIESFWVIFQTLGWMPSTNSLYKATGTWINPNVTAMFLALSIYLILKSGYFISKKLQASIALSIIIVSITLLQCRTAYIISFTAVFFHYYPALIVKFKDRFSNSSRKYIVAGTITVMSCLVLFVFLAKKDSTDGRLLILKNSFAMISDISFNGVGFGHFAKEYNMYVASHKLISKGHVNMPYNDFVELMVEGGFIAVLLWIAFLISSTIYLFKANKSLFPPIAMILIQATNFGFQAVPVFATLLLYMAYPFSKNNLKNKLPHNINGLAAFPEEILTYKSYIRVAFVVVSLVTLFYQLRLKSAFQELNAISEDDYIFSIDKLEFLGDPLNGQAFYHEKMGDAYMKAKNLDQASKQYEFALTQCTYPFILIKLGIIHQVKTNYDSSLYYYNIARMLEPDKLATRMFILKLYKDKMDTTQMLSVAREIVDMPVKVKNEKADRIKKYANEILNKTK